MIISERIFKILEEKNMSQSAFAKKAIDEVYGGIKADRRVRGVEV